MVLDAQQTGGDGAHEDDAAIVLNILVRGLANKELRAGVQVEDVVVLLLRNLLGDVPALGPGVGHDDVDLAEGLLALLEQAGDLGDLADVGADGDGFGAVVEALDDLDDFLRWALRGDVVDDDGGAALAQLDGTATADSATGAGDEGDLPVERGCGDCDDHFGCEGRGHVFMFEIVLLAGCEGRDEALWWKSRMEADGYNAS